MSCNGCSFELMVGIGAPEGAPDPCLHYPFYYDMEGRTWWVWTDNGWHEVLSPLRWMSEAFTCALDGETFISINQGGTIGEWASGDYKITTLSCLFNWVIVRLAGRFSQSERGQQVYAGLDNTDPTQPKLRLRTIVGVEGVASGYSDDQNEIEIRFDPSTLTDAQMLALVQRIAANQTAVQLLAAAMRLGWLHDVDLSSPSDDDVLAFDATTGKWVNRSLTELPHSLVVAKCSRDGAAPSGLANGDYWLNLASSPKRLFVRQDGGDVLLAPGVDTPIVYVVCACEGEYEAYKWCDGDWHRAVLNLDDVRRAVNETQVAYVARSEGEAVNLGMQPGQFWLDVSSTPPVLYRYDGPGSSTPDTQPEVVYNTDGTGIWLRDVGGRLVQYDPGAPTPPNEVQVAVCAASETEALQAGLQPNGYWMDTSATPPVLRFYDGVSSSSVVAAQLPESVFCMNTGAVYLLRGGGYALLPVYERPDVPISTGIITAVCAPTMAAAQAGGLVAGGYWLDTSQTPLKLYHYDGSGTTEITGLRRPGTVVCCNSRSMYSLCGGNYELICECAGSGGPDYPWVRGFEFDNVSGLGAYGGDDAGPIAYVHYRFGVPKRFLGIPPGANVTGFRVGLKNACMWAEVTVHELCLGWYDPAEPYNPIVGKTFPVPTFSNTGGGSLPITLAPSQVIVSDDMAYSFAENDPAFSGLFVHLKIQLHFETVYGPLNATLVKYGAVGFFGNVPLAGWKYLTNVINSTAFTPQPCGVLSQSDASRWFDANTPSQYLFYPYPDKMPLINLLHWKLQ